MTFSLHFRQLAGVASTSALFAVAPANAEMSAEELAKLAQNPVGNLISLPFQNNANLNFGPEKGTQNILNIQPVIPISISKDWNIITRTIVPVIWLPSLGPGVDSTNGIGDTVFTAFLSPANPGKWIWGAGPVVQIPTNSEAQLGNKNWGLGPSFVVLHLEHDDPWVFGVLVNNIWSLTSNKTGGSYNNGLIQPFVNYNFKDGFYLDQRADPDGRLAGGEWPAVDRAARRRRRQRSFTSAGGEHADQRVLQRGRARFRAELADSRASSADVSQMNRRVTAMSRAGWQIMHRGRVVFAPE